ncbi:NUDIX hydrolase [Nesterenkonia cremea]|uniref:Nudix hydrolase domain-containing protein n=1 Tax=Nesterenkonia cremea TaxID=1882340 RepID=A0A917AW92_9MICC|nr:CoA pyrophosphatase [Nesterenkonia cremea]GGE75402.1 hypothetical protein GCM10011401_23380 [Nesterenkonia cremea]
MPEPSAHALSRSQLESQLEALVRDAADYSSRHPQGAAEGAWWERMPAELPGPGSASWQLRPDDEDWDPAVVGSWRRAAVLFLVCLPEDGAEPYLLLTERSAGLAKHPGQVSLPGGKQEEFDAGPAACALREAQEEIGLDVSRVSLVGTLPPAPVPVSGFIVTPIVATAADPGVLTPQAGEVERVLHVPLQALIDPQNRRSAAIRWKGVERRSPAFLCDGALIWGFTGILLDRVLDRLGWSQPWDESRSLDPREHQRLG